MSHIADAHFCQAEMNLRLKRTPERITNDVRELEQLLGGLGRLTAAQIEGLRPEWAEAEHRYVRKLSGLSAAIVSAPGRSGYMLASTLSVEELRDLYGARRSQIREMARPLIALGRLIALREAAAKLTPVTQP